MQSQAKWIAVILGGLFTAHAQVLSVDSLGNVTAQGKASVLALQTTDTAHTSALGLFPGASTNFLSPVPVGAFYLFLDSNNGNRLSRVDSNAVITPVEGIPGPPGPQGPAGPQGPPGGGGGGSASMAAYGSWLPFGRCAWCSSGPSMPANSGYQEQFTAPFSISLGTVTFQQTGSGPASTAVVCIYSDTTGSVGALLGSSQPVSNTGTGVVKAAFASPVALSAGTPYWLTIASDVAGLSLGVSGSGADNILYLGASRPRTDSGGTYTTGTGTGLACKPTGVMGGYPQPLVNAAFFQNY